jgi:hypothetical protein
MQTAKELAQSLHYRRTGQQLPLNATLETVFAIIDHFNELHFHDRNRASERIAKLEKASDPR